MSAKADRNDWIVKRECSADLLNALNATICSHGKVYEYLECITFDIIHCNALVSNAVFY